MRKHLKKIVLIVKQKSALNSCGRNRQHCAKRLNIKKSNIAVMKREQEYKKTASKMATEYKLYDVKITVQKMFAGFG